MTNAMWSQSNVVFYSVEVSPVLPIYSFQMFYIFQHNLFSYFVW